MQARNIIRTPITLTYFVLLSLLSSSFAPPRTAPFSYRILQSSRIYVEGTSNVTSFTCTCTCVQSFPRLQFEMNVRENGYRAEFDESTLSIRTKALDCGNRGMNRDLYSALEADKYPAITLSLQEAALPTGAQLASGGGWAHINAHAKLTIAGVTRNIKLPVRASQTGPHSYRFISKRSIKLTDFNIEPPTAMLGLVKVDDEIEINFDLHITVEQLG